ncbi:MAG: hypothetical protein HN742_02460 [Lentisphaerae bacterium]|nr:hypothetical protein [Lentisphaerota bacterium]MBT5610918.1 hypothetical protein [Lentisphaerota bacterium]MBT7053441.1 hypothetical protein [Lentisphaerota bacterium]MBT7840701.1 hypothetical protein [Lentisphaerota bacterium]
MNARRHRVAALLSILMGCVLVFMAAVSCRRGGGNERKPIICDAREYDNLPNGTLIAITGKTGRPFPEAKEMEFVTADGTHLTLIGELVLHAPNNQLVCVVGTKEELSLPTHGFTGVGPPPRWLKQMIHVESIEKAQHLDPLDGSASRRHK